MPVAGQTPTRIHLIDSESVTWESGAAYVDPNDATKLVRDVHAHAQEFQLYAADTGAANAYVITLSPAPTIVVGTKFVIKAAHANTGASTLVVDGAAAVPIVKQASAALSGGEILANQIFEVTFDGANYQLAIDSSPNTGVYSTAGITIDGGSSTPATGSKGFLQVPFAATITGWTLLADASGSAQITVKKCSDAGFPTTSSIVASAPPALSSAQKGESSTLTGWTTAIAAGDILEFNLDSVATCKRLTLEIKLTRS
jgi:hypothetical protein